MAYDILNSLNDLGYEGLLLDKVTFSKALDGGLKSLEYTKLIHILAEELKKLCQLKETVHMMNDLNESSFFLLELSSFLKKLGCPYKNLVTGHISSRLQTKKDRVLLLDFLISELMTTRMVQVDKPKEKTTSTMNIVMPESPTAKDLKDILIALKFKKPPPDITPEVLFSKLEAKLKDSIREDGDQLLGKPLYTKALKEKRWKQLERRFNNMFENYRFRRETLITCLDCTIQSFEWSDRLKTKKDLIQITYRPKRDQIKAEPDVRLSDFLAARTSLLQVGKTYNANVRKNTHTDVNKVIIGQGSTKPASSTENTSLTVITQPIRPMDNLAYQTGIPGSSGSQCRSVTAGQTKGIPLLPTPITTLQPNEKDLPLTLNSYGTPINEPKARNKTFVEGITDEDNSRWIRRYKAFIAKQFKKRLANKRIEASGDGSRNIGLGIVKATFETQNPPVLEGQHPVTMASVSHDIKSLKRSLPEEELPTNQAKKTKSGDWMSGAPKTMSESQLSLVNSQLPKAKAAVVNVPNSKADVLLETPTSSSRDEDNGSGKDKDCNLTWTKSKWKREKRKLYKRLMEAKTTSGSQVPLTKPAGSGTEKQQQRPPKVKGGTNPDEGPSQRPPKRQTRSDGADGPRAAAEEQSDLAVYVHRGDGVRVDEAVAAHIREKLVGLIEERLLARIEGDEGRSTAFATSGLVSEGFFLVTPYTVEARKWILSCDLGEYDGTTLEIKPLARNRVTVWLPGRKGDHSKALTFLQLANEHQEELKMQEWTLLYKEELATGIRLVLGVPNGVFGEERDHAWLHYQLTRVQARLLRAGKKGNTPQTWGSVPNTVTRAEQPNRSAVTHTREQTCGPPGGRGIKRWDNCEATSGPQPLWPSFLAHGETKPHVTNTSPGPMPSTKGLEPPGSSPVNLRCTTPRTKH